MKKESEKSKAPQTSELADLLECHVMVLDANGTSITQILERNGFKNVTHVSTDKAALDKYKRDNIDLVLLDRLIPELSNQQLVNKLSQDKTVPVIQITTPAAMRRHGVEHINQAIGKDDLIFRPINDLEFMLRVRRALTTRRAALQKSVYASDSVDDNESSGILEDRVRYLADHDPLTNLYNRHYIEQSLETAIKEAGSGQGDSRLLYIDIDRFKLIRNYAGQTAGNRILRNVAEVLRKSSNPNYVVAHLESDEFAILLRNTGPAETADFADTLRHELGKICFRDNTQLYTIQSSIGIVTVAGEPDINYEKLISHARQASYVAKRRGGNIIHHYRPDDVELMDQKKAAHWTPLIQSALKQNRFRLVFQPVLRIADMNINHYEVLVRMLGSNDELLSPAEFIPVAEQMGLIHEIDRWVIREAINELGKRTQEFPDLAFNINLSGRAFQDENLLPEIRNCLNETGVSADRITFEITETAMIDNIEQTREMVTQLRELGCQFALDDFGAGFASYSYLKEFPFDFLKIDGSFIVNLTRDPMDQILVKSMVNIARTLGKETTAEFVGDSETLKLLDAYGVDNAQGYYIGKPDTALVKRPLLSKQYSE